MLIFPNIVVNIGLIICGINFELTNWLSLTNTHSIRGTMFMNITEICLQHHHGDSHDDIHDDSHDGDDGNRVSQSSRNYHRNNEKEDDDIHHNNERSSRYKGIKIRIKKYNSDNNNNNNDDVIDEAANECMHLLMLEWNQQQQQQSNFHDNEIINYSYSNNSINDDYSNRIIDANHVRGNKDTFDDDDKMYNLYGRVIFPKVYYMNTQHFSGDLYLC